MIYHLSIAAIQPRRVADVLAELWNGEVFPFPAVAKGSFAVLAGDDRNSLIEIYPLGTELVLEADSSDAGSRHNPEASGRSATHAAISSRSCPQARSLRSPSVKVGAQDIASAAATSACSNFGLRTSPWSRC
jgi:hypothetical protein